MSPRASGTVHPRVNPFVREQRLASLLTQLPCGQIAAPNPSDEGPGDHGGRFAPALSCIRE
jgi:hypothetical protein